jgi:hypothetical protein
VNQSITGVETPISYTINSGGANEEIVTLVDKNTSTSPSQFENCVRGCDGTADQSHSSGEVLTHEITARDFVTPRQFAFSGEDMWADGIWQSLMVPYARSGADDTTYHNNLHLARFSLAERLELDQIKIRVGTGGSTDEQVDFVLYQAPSPDAYVQMLGTIQGTDGLDSAGIKGTNTGLGIEIGPGTWWLGRRGHGFSTPPSLRLAGEYMDPVDMGIRLLSDVGNKRGEARTDSFTDYQDFTVFYQATQRGIQTLMSFNEVI